MALIGHEKPVMSVRFNPKGTQLASGGHDHQILLWKVYGDCQNFMTFKGHTGPILELAWNSDGTQLYSASADKSGAAWDLESGERIKRFRNHASFVNAVAASRKGTQYALTGSDDCTAMMWDLRAKYEVKRFDHDYQVTAVAFNDDSSQVFTGSIDNVIYCWDVRKGQQLYTMQGHLDSLTGIRLSPNGNFLLSNSMDNTVRIWDVRAYVSGSRQTALLEGVQHDFQKQLLRCAWSNDGTRAAAASADRFVYIWDASTGRTLYKLPGHTGCVNDVDFHPTEPIIASGANDKTIYMGEIAASL
jgi:Prp8 binding protein